MAGSGLLGRMWSDDEPRGLLGRTRNEQIAQLLLDEAIPTFRDIPSSPTVSSTGGVTPQVLSEALTTMPSVQSIKSAVTLPGDVWAGRQPMGLPSETEDLSRVADLAGLAMTGGIAGGPRGAMGSGPIRAYHGSPHDFDKFSLDKIGTGEGAQAYGHGLYFAENEGVARGYRQALERRNIDVKLDGKPIEHWPSVVETVSRDDWRLGKLLDDYGRLGGDPQKFIREQRDWYRGQPEMEAAIERFTKQVQASHTPGRMYEVAIHADPERFLDWDKPIDAQPRIRGMVADLMDARGQKMHGGVADLVYGDLRRAMGGQAEASAALREAGIPGIKYLDAGSRSAGDGSRNYVVFDDKLVEILKKYGVASFAALPPAVQMALQAGQQPPE